MEFDKVIKQRHCVHELSSKRVSWKDILEAVDSAVQGPFAGNINNLKFVIVENPKTIKEIAKHAHQTWITQSNLVVVVCSDDTHLENQYGERGRIYTKQQAGAAIMTFILKLTEHGLSTCWIGAFTDELIRNALNIPSHINVEAILPIGYEKPLKFKKEKKRKSELETVLFWEEWKKERRPTSFEESKGDLEY